MNIFPGGSFIAVNLLLFAIFLIQLQPGLLLLATLPFSYSIRNIPIGPLAWHYGFVLESAAASYSCPLFVR